MHDSNDRLEWSVALPERRGPALSGPRPRAEITLVTPDRGEEHLSIPLSVGKTLKAKLDSNELNPSSRAELLYALREESARQASLRIERLVNRRDYATQEIDEKLRQDGFSQASREAAISRAVDANILNDQRYASVFVRSKLSSGWGTMRIERELRRRGIDLGELDGWPDEFLEDQDEDTRAYELAQTRRISPKNGYEKLVRFLCSKGYSLSVSMRVARRVIDERESE